MRSYYFLKFLIIILCAFTTTFAAIHEETFIIMDGSTGKVLVEEGFHMDDRATPACSFNIVLSLMGYDAEVLEDVNNPFWDYQEGYGTTWKSAHTPLLWMQHSCFWYSQLIAQKLGIENIQQYLGHFDYGNQDFSGGLKKAWLSSSLKISPREQVEIIQKMLMREFPVSEKSIEMTKELLFKEILPDGSKLYSKGGLGTFENTIKVRWFVGWIEKQNAFYPFAYHLLAEEVDLNATLPRVKTLLSVSIP